MNTHRTVQLVLLLAAPGQLCAQVLPEPATPTADQYLELIEQTQDESGLTALELIEPLTALGQQYLQQQEYELAAEVFGRARQIVRVNNGFDTPQELPLLAQQVSAEELRGNVVGAWELEQTLLTVAEHNIGSLETVPVFIAAAEKRMDIWHRYRNGDHPPEIELGCYYDRNTYLASMFRREPRSHVAESVRGNCGAGERGTVLVSLLVEARNFQLLAVESLLQNDVYAGEELQQRVTDVLRTSDAIQRRQLSSSDPALADLMVRLLTYEPKDRNEAVRRAQFLLQLADVNIVRARQARRLAGLASVREQYMQVWTALRGESVAQAMLDEIFLPAVPVMLPAFTPNPLTRVSEAESTGYVDVIFEVSDKGTARRVEVTGTAGNVERADVRELEQLIAMGSFRPRMQDGQVLETAPVSLRYYVANPVSTTVTSTASSN